MLFLGIVSINTKSGTIDQLRLGDQPVGHPWPAAMRAGYPYVHSLIKNKLTISCTTASVERCVSKMAVL